MGKALKKAIRSEIQKKVNGSRRASRARGLVKDGIAFIGSGDYVPVSRNINSGRGGAASNSSSFSILERTEYVADIVTSAVAGQTNIQKFRINPGNGVLFPWASTVAKQFESYIPMQCVFEYKSTSVDALNSTNTALGKVAMAVQYNTFARDWDSLDEIENANSSVITKPSKGAMCGVECKAGLRGANALFVSSTSAEDSGRPFYDIGDFYISTTGMQAASVKVGSLYVRYKVKVFNPIVNDESSPTLEYVITDADVNSTSAAFSGPNAVRSVDSFTPYYGDSFSAVLTTTTLTMTFPPLRGDTLIMVDRVRVGASITRSSNQISATSTPSGSVAKYSSFDGYEEIYSNSATATVTMSRQRLLAQAGTTQIVFTVASEVGATADNAGTSFVFIPWEKNQ